MWKQLDAFVIFSFLLLPAVGHGAVSHGAAGHGAAGHGEIEITGRISTAGGAPLFDAEVALVEWPRPFELGVLLSEGETQPTPVATTRTDENGLYRLVVPEPGMWRVVVRPEGFLPMEHPLLPLLESTSLRPLTLREASPLEVQVLDARGRPLEGALARITEEVRWSRWTDSWGDWWPSSSVGVTDSRGRLFLPRGRKEVLELRAWAPGYQESKVRKTHGRGVEVRLRESEERVLEVRQPNRKQAASDVLFFLGMGRWPAGRSDLSGRVTLVAPLQEEVSLELVVEDGPAGNFRIGPVKPGSEKPPSLVLPPERTLSGHVVDATSSEPVPAAWVWLKGDPSTWTRTDTAGLYTIPVRTTSLDGNVAATALGYLPDSKEMVEESPGVYRAIRLSLEPSVGLGGVVLDTEEHIVASARIEARPETRRSRPGRAAPSATVASDSRGRFRLPSLAAQTRYGLTVKADGFAPTRVEVAGLEPGRFREGFRIILEQGRQAVGTILDIDDEPVAGAAVALQSAVIHRAFENHPAFESSADRHGEFVIDHLPTGRYDLVASASGFAPAVVRGLTIAESPGAVDLGTVYLQAGAVLEGRVTTADSELLEGVDVHVRAAVGGDYGLRTGVDGAFTVADLQPGEPVDIQLFKDGYQPRSLTGVQVTSQPLVLVLRPASRIYGKVVDADRRPVTAARVVLTHDPGKVTKGLMVADAGNQAGLSGPDGEFMIDNIPPGRHALKVAAEVFA